jgi:hypothetical protein
MRSVSQLEEKDDSGEIPGNDVNDANDDKDDKDHTDLTDPSRPTSPEDVSRDETPDLPPPPLREMPPSQDERGEL